MQLWRADLHIPFQYKKDSIMTGEWVKSIIDNGWFLDNRYIGMPTGKNLRDVPMSDNVHYAIIKIITLFTNNFAVTINIFYILAFPLIVCTSYYVFRKFSISPYLSFIGATLYAFLEYHYFRNIAHIFLSAYYMNPLIIMVILWLFSGALDTISIDRASRRCTGSINPKFAGSVIISILVSASGIYYAYFSCYLLLIAGSVRSFWQQSLRPVVIAVILISIITIGGILNLSPVILYQLQHGSNPSASARVLHEAELYSLKITELLLPVTGHRIKFLADLKDKYNRETSFIYRFYEPKVGASLGIIGSAGFIFLLIFLIVYRKNINNSKDDIDRQHLLLFLSILNITALLMVTVGGFDSIVAYIVRYKIRGYERLSIFIAFFALFAVIILIQNFYDKYVENTKKKLITFNDKKISPRSTAFYIVMFMVLFAGLYDQAGIFSTPDYDSVKKEFLNDKTFVTRIEQSLPPNSMIFQLPYIAYPETKHPYRMKDYDHLKLYLHTTKLRWSYGTVKGRPGDSWQKETTSKPTRDMIKEISRKGFKGVVIDRNGYQDNGEKIIQEIQNILRVDPIMSNDEIKVFFSLI